jgi:hypothetical protein
MKTVDFIQASLVGSARGVTSLIEDMKDIQFTFPKSWAFTARDQRNQAASVFAVLMGKREGMS